jgi:2-polyprenyl-3-methyl-5-hydroxy-6-metoxy-1,4-benzoquinol methylase
MAIDPHSDAKIIDSWHKNAAPWIVAIHEHQIESRNLVTNDAIVDTVVSCGGNKVLDIGCGEGWLARELSSQGMQVLGVDIVHKLIDRAQLNVSDARFKVLSYEEIAAGKLAEKFDVAVANFSLLGDESVTSLFRSMRSILNPQGRFIIQTMHPAIACGDRPYLDGWRSGSWAGFSADFTDPAPWYFRTLATWINLYISNGFSLVEIREPIHPQTGKPVAAIFMGVVKSESRQSTLTALKY